MDTENFELPTPRRDFFLVQAGTVAVIARLLPENSRQRSHQLFASRRHGPRPSELFRLAQHQTTEMFPVKHMISFVLLTHASSPEIPGSVVV